MLELLATARAADSVMTALGVRRCAVLCLLAAAIATGCGDGANVSPTSDSQGSLDAPSAASESSPTPLTDFPGGAVPVGVVAGKPNVLVITIDTLRADHLGAYGYFRPTSPRLNELAESSVVFEKAFAPIATTLPSHTSMFTGVYPHEHGVLANIADGRTYERRPELVTLPAFFAAEGYATQAVVSALPLHPRFGLDAGFQGYNAPDGKQRGAKASTDKALAALEVLSTADQPGFLWVHYFDPHGPYNPPYKHEIKFAMDDQTRAYLDERRFAERAQRPTGHWNELEEGIDRYDGEIAYVDFQINRLLGAAADAGWLEGAVIAVLADHGEGLNQHGVPGHGLVWEEQLHVPLMLSIPGVAPRRIPWAVSLVDFAPTLLHVLDLPGKSSFLKQVTGMSRFRTDVVHGDARILGQSSPRQSKTDSIRYSLRADRWKLHMEEDGTMRLYDLESDPFELADVSSEHGRVVQALKKELDLILAVQRREVTLHEASDELRQKLRSMGYGGTEDR